MPSLGKEYVYTIEHEINDVNLSQDGCVCPKWVGNFKLEQSDGQLVSEVQTENPLQEYGKRQIWLKICGQTKRYKFHVGKRDETDLECKLLM